ncbi:formylglycine-generating enzyme required for sulfatase activity [Streptomyces sp. V4I8]|uniref:SUMF1/EgtB/PvdO family nonheme iron enzyme n=1 Tax=Streptomyces sp. V4I8 TaxID=3156469 RepID=UPI0035126D7A
MSGERRVPAYLGRVLTDDGEPAGTCFQVTPGVLATAWHVLADVGAERVGDTVAVDGLPAGGQSPALAEVFRIDPAHDLAVLRRELPLPASIGRLLFSDGQDVGTEVVVTGHARVPDQARPYGSQRYVDAPGIWAGGTLRDDTIALGRLSSRDLMRGMSGAPVRRRSDGAVVGVVSERYNSADGWLRDSVWVARTEDLVPLLPVPGGLPAHSGPPPPVRARPTPARPAGRTRPLEFRAAPGGGSRVTAAELRAAWDDQAHTGRPLALVTDFAPDAEAALAALTVADRPVRWIDGQSLLDPEPPTRWDSDAPDPASPQGPQGPAHARTRRAARLPDPPTRWDSDTADPAGLADLPPGLLLVDFSSARPDRLDRVDTARTSALLRELLWWAGLRGHRVALGLPRYVAPVLDLGACEVHRSERLFSPAYAYRVRECERLLRGPLPVQDVLRPLLSANSAALPPVVAGLLAGRPAGAARKPTLTGPDLIALARGLTEEGFYEIAYRLEAHCRTAPGQELLVPLTADIWPHPGVADHDTVVGFAPSTTDLPALLRRGVLSGPAGSGKSTALTDIEHRWSIPHLDQDATPAVTYVPLLVSLDASPEDDGEKDHDGRGDEGRGDEGKGEGDDEGGRSGAPAARALRRRIDLYLRREEFRWFEHGDDGGELACHALLGRLGSLGRLRDLFGSPVLLLLDDADRLPAALQDRLADEVTALGRDAADAGILLAARGERLAQTLKWREARLRDLDERQVELFVERRRGHPALPDLLTAFDRPVSGHIRNPHLLELLCDMAPVGDELRDANLRMIVEGHLEHRARRASRSGRPPRATVDDGVRWAVGERAADLAVWLPETACELLVSRRRRRQVRTRRERLLAADARLLGLLRPHPTGDVVEFTSATLRDYFAAVHLAARIRRFRRVESSLSGYLRRLDEDDWAAGEWRGVCLFLAALLPERDARRLAEVLVDHGQARLAHECALELLHAPRVGAFTARALGERVRASAQNPAALAARIEDTRALGRHDPRIKVDRPLDGMVEIPATQRTGAFRIGRYPVTVMEFARFVDDGGYHVPDWWSETGLEWRNQEGVRHPRYWRNPVVSRPNHPVTGVNFFEASAYCAWLTHQRPAHVFRLPSALEWDRAAHGDDRVLELMTTMSGLARRPDEPPSGELVEITERTKELAAQVRGQLAAYDEIPAPVGMLPPTRFGVHDLLGVLWQWCGTSIDLLSATELEFRDLPAAPVTDPAAERGHVLRARRSARAGTVPDVDRGTRVVVKGGGPTGTLSPTSLLTGGWFDPHVRFHHLGFRVTCRPAAD